MNSRIARPIALAALALSAAALGTGTATAAGPVAGSVEVCAPLPLGPLELSLCL
ncbi:hypothetical protein [Nocardia ignorata]|uniref:Uncharacterized protein n=1 Tax=Nocardia ignorata TaxID=145285 RepID=A0A4R6PI78_NOCIG|nr:hypothetical protein [Nocardia ignorata]TDP38048.1 hypothetical protein DFR75_104400 [Nocardia ignorata]